MAAVPHPGLSGTSQASVSKGIETWRDQNSFGQLRMAAVLLGRETRIAAQAIEAGTKYPAKRVQPKFQRRWDGDVIRYYSAEDMASGQGRGPFGDRRSPIGINVGRC